MKETTASAIQRIKTSPQTELLFAKSGETRPLKTIIFVAGPENSLFADKYLGGASWILLQLINQLEIDVNAGVMSIGVVHEYQKEIISELRKLKLVHPMRLCKMEDLPESTEGQNEFYKMAAARREEFIAASPIIKQAFAKLETIRQANQEKLSYYVVHQPTEDIIVDGLVPAIRYVLSTVGTFGAILSNEEEITSFIKTQGRDYLPPDIDSTQKKKILTEVQLLVKENRNDFPQAYAQLTAQNTQERS